MKSTRTSSLLLEQAESLPGLGPALLVTVLVSDAARALRVIEHHVFLPGAGVAVSETTYPSRVPRAWRKVEALARVGTRALAVKEAARQGVLLPAAVVDRGVRLLDPVHSNPFAPLLEVPALEQSLWEIQEWTASRDLRALLAQAVACPVPVAV